MYIQAGQHVCVHTGWPTGLCTYRLANKFVPETRGLREDDCFIAIPRSLFSPRSSLNLSVWPGSLSPPTKEGRGGRERRRERDFLRTLICGLVRCLLLHGRKGGTGREGGIEGEKAEGKERWSRIFCQL